MNERDESELDAAADDLVANVFGEGKEPDQEFAYVMVRYMTAVRNDERSREREQTLALLEALRRVKTWFENPSTDGARVSQYMAIEHEIASYEAAHALQVAHEEVKGG